MTCPYDDVDEMTGTGRLESRQRPRYHRSQKLRYRQQKRCKNKKLLGLKRVKTEWTKQGVIRGDTGSRFRRRPAGFDARQIYKSISRMCYLDNDGQFDNRSHGRTLTRTRNGSGTRPRRIASRGDNFRLTCSANAFLKMYEG